MQGLKFAKISAHKWGMAQKRRTKQLTQAKTVKKPGKSTTEGSRKYTGRLRGFRKNLYRSQQGTGVQNNKQPRM